MKALHINLLLLLILLTLAKNKKNLKRLIRQSYAKNGHPSLYNCETKEDRARNTPLPINFELTIAPKWTDYKEFIQDPSLPLKYHWTYRMVKEIKEKGIKVEKPFSISRFENRKKASLTFGSYSLTPGLYKIYPNATRNPRDKLKPFMIKVCHLYVMGLPPVAVIAGGTYRLVPSDTPIVLNGSESIDMNKPTKDGTTLKYQWSCTQKLASQTFCNRNPISTRNSFVIPQKHIREGDKLQVVLQVTTGYDTTAEARQEIEIVDGGVLLEIKCRKNCPPVSEWSNINIVTFLGVMCEKNCDDVYEEDYVWSIRTKSGTDFGFNYARDTQFGNKGEKFIIDKNRLKPGEYEVRVFLNSTANKKGEARTTMIFEAPPQVDQCVTKPDQGESLKTYFVLECNQKPSFRRHFYELYFNEEVDDTNLGQLIIDGFHPEIHMVPFMLPSSQNRKFVVKVSLENGPYTLVPISPTVTSSLSGQSTEEKQKTFKEIYDGKISNGSLTKLMASDILEHRKIAFQTFQALVNELADVDNKEEKFQEFVEDFKYRAIDDLLKVPFTSVSEIVKMGDVVAKLMSYNEPNASDPLMAKFSSTLCTKMVQKHLETMKKERFPLNYGDASSKVLRTLTKCFEANTNPNFDLLVPLPVYFSTEAPVSFEEILIEEYPDYHDFGDSYYKDIENLQASTQNLLEGIAASAKAVALSTAVGEKQISLRGRISEAVIVKDKAQVLAKLKLESSGVALVPSRDFVDSEHPVDILMSTWTKDILWWNLNKIKVATDIVSIEFWHSTCRANIKQFVKPAQIYFELNKHFKPVIIDGVVQVPKNYSKLFHYELNPHIHIRRVFIPYHRTLLVEFHNLSDTVFDAVVTLFKFPTIEDFALKETIKMNGTTFLVLPNYYNFNGWGYVGILPKKGNITKSPIKYHISFVASGCVRWKPLDSQWEPACTPGERSNITKIHCKCKYFSTIAGHVQNLQSVPQQRSKEEITLELQSQLIIFITVASVLFLYCLLVLLTLIKRKQVRFSFQTDNLATDRYAYLVLVTTGKKGTTSHVTIKISGKKGSSPAHVLNYPDPKVRLLQRKSKDAFVVTNQKHLGKILEIELWVDCIGASPSWFCEEIEIYDLQKKKLWYFKVGRLFSAEKFVFVSLNPTQRESHQKPVVKLLKKVTFWNGFHTWCFWAHERNFSYVKRLTVVLSTILMTFAVVLMVQGVPEMEVRDSLDLNQFDMSWFVVASAVVGSLVAFIFHIALAWVFRVSEVQFSESADDRLPYSVTKTCWRVLIILMIASITFLVVWGFWLPYNQSLVWLTACGIAVLLDVIIYENAFIILISFFREYEKVEYIGERYDTVVSVIEKQRHLLQQSFGGSLLRPLVEHLHQPLERTQIKERKIKEKIRKNFSEELTDLVMFGIYTILLYVVILVNKDSFTVVSKNEILSMFEGEHTRTLSFTSIESVEQLYDYINKTLIPVMQPVSWYKKFPISEPGMMVDFANKYIGVARFRQQRIMTDKCASDFMSFVNVSRCWPEFTSSHAESRNFGYGWGNLSTALALDRLRTIWQYLSDEETQTLTFIGEFASYPGGGYVAYLGRNLRNSLVNFRKMVKKFWIDQKTRSFFIEFLAYNCNYNMLNAVRLLFEQSATGYVASTIEIYSVRMVFVHNEMEQITIIFFFLFIAWVLLLLLKHSIGLIKYFRTVYKNFWFLVDLVIILMSLICIIAYLLRLQMIGEYLDTLENVKHNEFIGYFTLFYIEDFMTSCAAFLVLISTIRLWKFLRFGLFFRIMETTLSVATFPLLSATLAFFVVLLAFGLSGLLIFGNEFPELSSLIKIIATLITLALKPDQFDMSDYTNFMLAYWYFASYLLLMQVLVFIYIIIIIMSYVKAQLDFSGEAAAYNLKAFVEEQTQYIPTLFRQKYERMSGGEEKKYVRAKRNEFRYANCLSTPMSTLNSMKCIMRCVIRNIRSKKGNSLTDRDVKLMLMVCQLVALKRQEENRAEIFFKGHFVNEKVKLIDEKRISKIADVVELLLQQKQVREESKGKQTQDVTGQCVTIIRSYQETLRRCELILNLTYCTIKQVDLDLV